MNGAELLIKTAVGAGIANLHNARRAKTPLLNIIGEHATLASQRGPAARNGY